MSSRGERKFTRLSSLGAKNYDSLMGGEATGGHYPVFAKDLARLVPGGRLLDIGTGPGRMLAELHALVPGLELYGLDLSLAMVALARRRLAGTSVDLRVGSIEATDFRDGYFDAATCTKSFYLWDRPEACLAELHRILKPGGKAHLYESIRDCDRARVDALLREGLAKETFLRRAIGPGALRQQLAQTYTKAEYIDIAARSPFGEACEVSPMPTLLPVWVRVTLTKAGASAAGPLPV